jgi:hypothetical protein
MLSAFPYAWPFVRVRLINRALSLLAIAASDQD